MTTPSWGDQGNGPQWGPPGGEPPPGGQFPPPPPGQYHQPAPYYAAPRPTNGLAIASMVLGIIWLYWVGSILALVFGYIAKRQITERGEGGGGMATAGIVLGWIGVGFLALFIAIGLASFFAAGNASFDNSRFD